MFNIVMDILNVLVLSLNISIIVKNICVKELTLKDIFITTIIVFVLSYFLVLLNMNNLLIPGSIIILFLYFYLILKNVYHSVFISIFTQVIFALSDAIVGIIFMLILKISYAQITNNKVISLLVSFIILIVSYIISKIFIVFLKKQYYDTLKKMVKKDAIILTLCFIVALLSIYSYTILFKSWHQAPNKIFIILNFFLIISFFILLIIIVYSNNKNIKIYLENKHKDAELKQLKEYTEMLEAVSSDLRSFKHDFANIIQIMGEYLDSKKFDELDKFYRDELMPESKKILDKDRYFMLLKHIKIKPLKGLISSKIVIAQSKKINIRFEISEDIDEITISLIDICRIIGTLFDNAIEAAELCNNKFIEFIIFHNESSITFINNNSCPENQQPIYKIYEKNFSTKGAGRGIGLKSVRNILNEKYKNVTLTTNIENLVFKQELIINLP